MNTQEADSLLDSQQVSKMLRCSMPLVYKMADRGQLPCVRWKCPGAGKKKIRTTVRFRPEDIQAFIKQNYKKGAQ